MKSRERRGIVAALRDGGQPRCDLERRGLRRLCRVLHTDRTTRGGGSGRAGSRRRPYRRRRRLAALPENDRPRNDRNGEHAAGDLHGAGREVGVRRRRRRSSARPGISGSACARHSPSLRRPRTRSRPSSSHLPPADHSHLCSLDALVVLRIGPTVRPLRARASRRCAGALRAARTPRRGRAARRSNRATDRHPRHPHHPRSRGRRRPGTG